MVSVSAGQRDQLLAEGRAALARHAWRSAYEKLAAADGLEALLAADLEGLAEAAWWSGRLDECIAARERAYAGHTAAGDRRRAAWVAIWLVRDYRDRLAPALGAGWRNRAERLLAEEPECREHAWLAVLDSHSARVLGDLKGATRRAREATEIAVRVGSRDLEALGTLLLGLAQLAEGRVPNGLSLVDEATAAATGGELEPWATAAVYCNTIVACHELADYGRAGEWTEAAERWCERQEISGFPGECRVYRAEIMRVRGIWTDALHELRRACAELEAFSPRVAGEAFYELGLLRLRTGDLAAAEEAFRRAHRLGREPQPGLALLRLAEGRVDEAAALMRVTRRRKTSRVRRLARAAGPRGRTLTSIMLRLRPELADEAAGTLARARLLPAEVEIALATGDLKTASSAAAELGSVAAIFRTPALQAEAACANGAVGLAANKPAVAVTSLRRGLELWQQVDAPYEAARARVLLAAAYSADGEEQSAMLELRAARSAFEALGAAPDARRAAEQLGAESADEGRSPVHGQRTFMFTDIVRSTKLVEAIGDSAWEQLVAWHDRLLRSLFVRYEGDEIDHAGDGFFVSFRTAESGIACAVDIQRRLERHRTENGFAPQVRIGVHTGTAVRAGAAYRGKVVHEAARVASFAGPGQILATTPALAEAPPRFPVSDARLVDLRGIAEPMEVATVDWT